MNPRLYDLLDSRRTVLVGRRSVRRLRDETGGALVEFALVVPLLLALLMGIFEFGRAWNIYQVITDASREGARQAVVRDGANKQETVTAAISDRLRAASLLGSEEQLVVTYMADCGAFAEPTGQETDVAVYGCGWGREMGEEARVVIRAGYAFAILAPIVALLQGEGELGAVTLNSNYVMRNE